uniref:RP9 pre-mRNA splicing factor n=2 Tax=Bos TaxID=9903 RepID=A0A3Q1N0P4_BOVIN
MAKKLPDSMRGPATPELAQLHTPPPGGELWPPAPANLKTGLRSTTQDRAGHSAVQGAAGRGEGTRPGPAGRGAAAGGGAAGPGERGAEEVPSSPRGRAASAAPRGAAMSSRARRDDAGAGGARRPREPPEQELQRRRELKRRRQDAQQLQQLKHLESFYEKPPPGFIKEDETKPEDCIPDVPGNEHAREFLAHAPTKGLWMPLGKEVKVMQCWRCKRYGHRTGDKECPFFIKGNQKLEQFRVAHEDPMYDIIRENKRHEKDIRIQQLKQLLEDSTSDDDGSSSSSSEDKEKHKKKKKKEKHKKKKKEKKKKKKRKHKSSKSNESSDSE